MASSSSSSSSRDVPVTISNSNNNNNNAPSLDDYRQRHHRRYEEREVEAARVEQEDSDWELARTLQCHEELRLQQEMDLKHAEEVHRVQEMEQRQRDHLAGLAVDEHLPDDSGIRRPMRTGYTERLIDDGEYTIGEESERELLPLGDPDEENPSENPTTRRLLINRRGFGPIRWINAILTDASPNAWRCFGGGDCWCTKRILSACLMLLTVLLMLFIVVAIAVIDVNLIAY
ncbi:hypothetical protein Pmar_PMAR005335 [Perkinsus marinus ATCC 50983]|uniref:Uncharacterized protein n=1 Tax=Perkinsus marinus (strain ATCC 50983 / TXsc) TaxID=423536 RepID=C5KB98_PERM5|nr:hypothetical protein Pmar_PMAR005335 [Perkinsus marinus ATCC 50983]EER18424.1 hypothetical protein Pmar_PMAR005335 [Perkinsus marinus ATCC 50983]|eukprot:XP_002786628.1 hypothetical protein Pmar_PMAR005335 [Perkinsus marinus ATCC 50983]